MFRSKRLTPARDSTEMRNRELQNLYFQTQTEFTTVVLEVYA